MSTKMNNKINKLVKYYTENVVALNESNNEQVNKNDDLKKATAFGMATGIGTGTALALLNNSNPKDKVKLWAQIIQTKQAQLQAAKNAAEADKLRKQLEIVQSSMPKSVFQIISAHPWTHAGAFAAGFGTAKLGDRFQRTVMKKDAGKRNADITGGFFNISKDKKRELNYLNKRLQKNILSKFRSFNGNEDEVIDYSKIQDPKLRSMISDLMSSLKSQGRWLTSQRDIDKFRSQINAIERYMLNNNPELFYSRNNSGETTDLMHYLNSKYYKNPMDYIPDMHQALNREKDLIDKQLEPSKWRKRLQKWLA